MEKRLIIRCSDLRASRKDLRVLGVFNPAVIKKGEETIMLVRVAEASICNDKAVFRVPTWHKNKFKFIEVNRHDTNFDFSDARVIRNHEQNYLTSISHFRVARSLDGVNFIFDNTRVMPENDYESYGIEDPRITEIGDLYYITYSAISEHGINVGLMLTKDFVTFTRRGIILPFDNKDCVIFPKKINGNYYAFHRPSKSDFGQLDMWTSESPDLLHWGNHLVVSEARPAYQKSARVGAGAVPFLTERGWLAIYHAADNEHHYHLAALLLDKNNPTHVLMRSRKPLLSPEEDFEKNGFFGNVVFTCGVTNDKDVITIYYGVCDENIAMCKMPLNDIFANMEVVNDERN